MGSGTLTNANANRTSERVFAPVALFVALTTGHGTGLLVRRAKDVIFRTHNVIAGPVEANHDDTCRQE